MEGPSRKVRLMSQEVKATQCTTWVISSSAQKTRGIETNFLLLEDTKREGAREEGGEELGDVRAGEKLD